MMPQKNNPFMADGAPAQEFAKEMKLRIFIIANGAITNASLLNILSVQVP